MDNEHEHSPPNFPWVRLTLALQQAGISRPTWERWIREDRGGISSCTTKIGRAVYVNTAELSKWFEKEGR